MKGQKKRKIKGGKKEFGEGEMKDVGKSNNEKRESSAEFMYKRL